MNHDIARGGAGGNRHFDRRGVPACRRALRAVETDRAAALSGAEAGAGDGDGSADGGGSWRKASDAGRCNYGETFAIARTAGDLRRVCRALRPLRKIWSAAVSIDVTDDPSLVREMALAGCMGVFVGFESLTDANLADAKKKTPKTADYARRVQMLHDNGIQVNGSFVLGFDHDQKDVFAQTADWVEANRMECATFHILTPYPATPLFRQMEAEGRLLHRDWSRYDTGHAVFRPKNMTPEELERGYAWIYQRLFSHTSIWHRRPNDWRAVAPYLLMSYLYKRSNRFWHLLIKHDMVHAVWTPLMEITRLRHLRFRARLAQTMSPDVATANVITAGV